MGIQHEETLECPCPCHASGGTCAMCASMEGGAARKVESDPAEKLKNKIEASWGPTSDKPADAMIERMGSQWGAMIQQAKAEQTFREKLTKLYSEGEKKQ